eukprot:CAMPEP_0194139570 /NCGR_PEP_ID=MMETSP0152-20130528/9204_1 /TAXON_ID=1049557 /ORGANISM="Thalassiothrix antarctica, Strain L6-D1" /LENGTH=81 /DNA_ID=CAMNT_0038837463 /DNA_START=33 /DNA_END=275 /DNA_ORIENTATION=-
MGNTFCHPKETSDVIPTVENERVSVDSIKCPSGDSPTIHERKFLNTGKEINAEVSAVVGLAENLYVFGGSPPTNECWVYYY